MINNKTIIIVNGNYLNSDVIQSLNKTEVKIKNIKNDEIKNIKELFTVKENVSYNTNYYDFFRNKVNKYN